jgi:gluconate kinase
MIILITGASHTGKTLLAQKMLEKYKYPYLSIDHLKMGLIRSGNTELTPEDDEALTGYLWPIIREIVKTAIENKQNLIIEGCYIPFDWRRDFEERYLSSIRFICLAMSENYIENHFGEIIGYESEIEARMIDADCTKDSLKADNRDIINGFQHAGEQVVLIYSDYEQTIKGLLDRQSVFVRNRYENNISDRRYNGRR